MKVPWMFSALWFVLARQLLSVLIFVIFRILVEGSFNVEILEKVA